MSNAKNPFNIEIKTCSPNSEIPWYTENWYREDLVEALEFLQIPATEENVEKLLDECRHIFDDKSERNEMLVNKAREIFDWE